MLCMGCLATVHAQTFTQRIQKDSRAGEGKVTISHDKSIDDLVNSGNISGNGQQERKTEEQPPRTKTEVKVREQHRDTTNLDTQVIDTRRKVMRGGVKINGYRVQAFAGGNQRKDRQQAEHVGNLIKSHYPEEPIYVHFYSPRWICRVGNYRTYEEAHEMLMNIRKLGISGASVVKGKITVQY